MNRHKTVVAVAMTLLLVAGIMVPVAMAAEAEGLPIPPAWGQADRGDGPGVACRSNLPAHLFLRLLGRLDLGDRQVAEIEGILDAYFPRRQALHDECAELRLELMKLGLRPRENQEAIAAAVTELKALQEEMRELTQAETGDIWNVLTEEQQELIRNRLEGWRVRGGRRPFGGACRPGGPTTDEDSAPPTGDLEMSL